MNYYKITHFVPKSDEYSETFLWDHINFFAKEFSCLVISTGQFKYNVSGFENKNIGHRSLLTRFNFRFITYFIQSKFLNKRSHDFLRKHIKSDVYHFHYGYYIVDALHIANKNPEKKVIVSLHGTDFNMFLSKRIPMLCALKRFVSKPNCVLTVPSFFFRKIVSESGIQADTIRVVPNSVDDIFFNISSFPTAGSELVVSSVGRLIEVKGFSYLIDAMKIISEKNENIVLKILGDGPCKKNLEKKIKSLGLQSRVQLLGVGNKNDVLNLLTSSQIYAQPSIKEKNKQESFCVALAEAIVAGLPVVVSSGGAMVENLSNNSIWHQAVTPKSGRALATAILEIAEHLKTDYPKRSKHEKFRRHRIIGEWKQWYGMS